MLVADVVMAMVIAVASGAVEPTMVHTPRADRKAAVDDMATPPAVLPVGVAVSLVLGSVMVVVPPEERVGILQTPNLTGVQVTDRTGWRPAVASMLAVVVAAKTEEDPAVASIARATAVFFMNFMCNSSDDVFENETMLLPL